ncbi:hypothetical protein DPMN_072790 [Dreissena polymorpha]|uniref:DUF4590 domain-containing protein n=1 Tax=Dreissena polymorpha TaxID=45954 RepID=A0A9D4BXX8_DREPO|nr:hypothetical protein DPMN_072790 [Dreissena polymorpha]
MSHVHEGPLATYNSLTDPNLAGFFGNTRMRRHLRKNGLVNRRGEIISENQYRLNMARKEHKKHVKNLLAQAIVHKTLDLERYRQVEIKKKLEEIAKIEMVRRVRATRGRKGDEELLPYLTPRSHSRPQSGPSDASSSSYKRPKSAPGQPRHRVVSKTFSNDPYDEVIYMDNDGYPVEPPPASERYETKNTIRDSDIDTRHLYALDSEALHQYALRMSKAEKGRDGATSPYLISQYPVPPKSGRPSRSSSGRSRSGLKSPKSGSGRSSPRRSARMSGRPEYPAKRTQGSLMLHRQEPAMMHQGEIQTLCEITMKYHGPNLTLPRDQFDPTQEVSIEQQHCGGNTLPVFKERIQGGSTFSFVSRRHRGYPFSLTVYIDGRVDCRVSTCCEYKHAIGVKLGGKMGHFSLTGITGATPCYKCKLSVQAPPRSLKLKKGAAKKKKEPQGQEEVTVSGTPRTPITEKKQEKEGYIAGKSDDVEEDSSKGDNSLSSYTYKDKFKPHKSNRKRGSAENEAKDVKTKRKHSDSSSESVKDSLPNLMRIQEEKNAEEFVNVQGLDNSEQNLDLLASYGADKVDNNEKKSPEERDNEYDTFREIGDEVFSECTDKTKAEEIIEEEINNDFERDISIKEQLDKGNEVSDRDEMQHIWDKGHKTNKDSGGKRMKIKGDSVITVLDSNKATYKDDYEAEIKTEMSEEVIKEKKLSPTQDISGELDV